MRAMEDQMTQTKWEKGLKMKSTLRQEAVRRLFNTSNQPNIKTGSRLEKETRFVTLKALLLRSLNSRSCKVRGRGLNQVNDVENSI